MKTMSNYEVCLHAHDNAVLAYSRLGRARIAFNKAKASLEKAELVWKEQSTHCEVVLETMKDDLAEIRIKMDRLDVAC